MASSRGGRRHRSGCREDAALGFCKPRIPCGRFRAGGRAHGNHPAEGEGEAATQSRRAGPAGPCRARRSWGRRGRVFNRIAAALPILATTCDPNRPGSPSSACRDPPRTHPTPQIDGRTDQRQLMVRLPFCHVPHQHASIPPIPILQPILIFLGQRFREYRRQPHLRPLPADPPRPQLPASCGPPIGMLLSVVVGGAASPW